MPGVDVMAFGAHPDDIEIGCGGTLIKLVQAGHSVVLVDMVRGEMGTRGTAETRATEAEAARQIIGAQARENLALEDGFLEVTKESKARVAQVVRQYRPRMVLVPHNQRHRLPGRLPRRPGPVRDGAGGLPPASPALLWPPR